MIKHFAKTREKRKNRIRAKIHGTAARPRLSVFRSHTTIYAQLVDDDRGITIVGASDKQTAEKEKNKVARALALGKYLAKLAQEKKISTIVFDRSGYTYHGRVKALAEGLRSGGLKF